MLSNKPNCEQCLAQMKKNMSKYTQMSLNRPK